AQSETITLFDGAGPWRGVTPDGKTLLTNWPEAAKGDEPGPSVLLWDTVTGKRQGEIQGFFRRDSSGIASAFIADGRALVIVQQGPPGQATAVVWDLDTHVPLGKVPLWKRRIV